MRYYWLMFWILLPFNCFSAAQVGDAVITVDGNSASVNWTTDVPTGTKVLVKPDIASVEVIAGKSPSINHSVRLNGIHPGVSYVIITGTAKYWLTTNNLSISLPSKAAIAAVSPIARQTPRITDLQRTSSPVVVAAKPAPPTRATWANVISLPDHFARHGGDFHAKDQDDYARMAWEFLQRAKSEGLPCKEDEDGVLRIYDPKSGAFASYGRDGKTKTFFKPGSRDYFERQPGKTINLKNWK